MEITNYFYITSFVLVQKLMLNSMHRRHKSLVTFQKKTYF